MLLYQLTPETILPPNLNKSILSKDEICEQYKRRYVVQGLRKKYNKTVYRIFEKITYIRNVIQNPLHVLYLFTKLVYLVFLHALNLKHNRRTPLEETQCAVSKVEPFISFISRQALSNISSFLYNYQHNNL